MTVHDDKYVVFKRDDWEEFKRALQSSYQVEVEDDDIIKDAVVFRLQDMFANTAIRAYSDAVSNAIAIMESVGMTPDKELVAIADHFMALAADADTAGGRFPS